MKTLNLNECQLVQLSQDEQKEIGGGLTADNLVRIFRETENQRKDESWEKCFSGMPRPWFC